MDLLDQTPIIATQVLPESPDLTPPPLTPKKSPVLPILIGLIIAVLVGLVGYFGYQYFTLKSMLDVTPIPTPTPTSEASDPTIDWKTYTNKTHGYSIRYPSDKLTLCENYPNETDGPRFWAAGFDCPDGHDIPYIIGIISIKGLSAPQKTPTITNPVTIDGKPATKSVYTYGPEDGPLASLIESEEILIKFNQETIILQRHGSDTWKKEIFNQILSTFKFITQTEVSPTPSNITKLTHSIPSGWIKVLDPTGHFEAAYDPATTQLLEAGVEGINFTRKALNDDGIGYKSYMSIRLLPYDGGSTHQFIYQHLNNGNTPPKQDFSSNYFEKKYQYDGKNCTVLNGIFISQGSPVWGMCDAGGGQAFLFTSDDQTVSLYEQVIKTITLVK